MFASFDCMLWVHHIKNLFKAKWTNFAAICDEDDAWKNHWHPVKTLVDFKKSRDESAYRDLQSYELKLIQYFAHYMKFHTAVE